MSYSQSKYNKEWYKKNKEKKNIASRLWYWNNKDKVKENNKAKYIKKPSMKIERFFLRIEKTSTCWIWLGCKYKSGYGRIDSKTYAHRYSYILHKGEIPKGLHVCHSCDNPSCVNPDHLWIGTQKDNANDRDRKGRNRGGDNRPSLKR